ncbi:MAG TPA: cytochrome ubiquinol oxidase subunit I, partial [Longimicrobiaceae bacterium]|nr:cytochrome ubiquinol oxidase subunit I [Longimicrobiaceae bacterium]
EAIFLGLYLYGWDRLPPRAHLLTGIPVVLGGVASAAFVTTANAWMNGPVGLVEDADGALVAAEPLGPFLAATAAPQLVHMVLGAFLCTGFAVAAVYAVAILRDPARDDGYHRRGLLAGAVLGLVTAPLQVLAGDWATRAVAENQPAKFAAMEGLARTTDGAPFTVGGTFDERTGELTGAIEIPRLLSVLLTGDPDARITGLDAIPAADRPPVTITHTAFEVMIVIGTALLALSVWSLWLLRKRRHPADDRRFLWALAAAGPAPFVALLAGWIVTEVKRRYLPGTSHRSYRAAVTAL